MGLEPFCFSFKMKKTCKPCSHSSSCSEFILRSTRPSFRATARTPSGVFNRLEGDLLQVGMKKNIQISGGKERE